MFAKRILATGGTLALAAGLSAGLSGSASALRTWSGRPWLTSARA